MGRDLVRQRYQDIYGLLSRTELQRGAANEHDDLLFTDSSNKASTESLWLDFYTVDGLKDAFTQYGLYQDLFRIGFKVVEIETNTQDTDEHLLRIWSVDPAIDMPLVELVVRRSILMVHASFAEQLGLASLPVLSVEWLMMQNPTTSFSANRVPLPGQKFPGLGIGNQVMELLRNAAKRLGMAGVITIPSYFHNAAFYASDFKYIDGRCQGTFLALCRDILPAVKNSTAQASWALQWNTVVYEGQTPAKPAHWFHEAMIAPISPEITQYFERDEYTADIQRSLNEHHFDLLNEAFQHNLRAKGFAPWNGERIQKWLPT